MASLAETFADVSPIEQDDGPTPVVRIAYSHAFSTVMGYFRRVLVDGEYSQRALLLSAGGCTRTSAEAHISPSRRSAPQPC